MRRKNYNPKNILCKEIYDSRFLFPFIKYGSKVKNRLLYIEYFLRNFYMRNFKSFFRRYITPNYYLYKDFIFFFKKTYNFFLFKKFIFYKNKFFILNSFPFFSRNNILLNNKLRYFFLQNKINFLNLNISIFKADTFYKEPLFLNGRNIIASNLNLDENFLLNIQNDEDLKNFVLLKFINSDALNFDYYNLSYFFYLDIFFLNLLEIYKINTILYLNKL